MNAPAVSLHEMKSPAPREANLPAVTPGFGSLQSFELAVRQAKLLSSSTLVPAQYRSVIEKKKGRDTVYEDNDNAIPNCVIAMNMATRMGADPLMVMQNLYIVEGRPSWSSQWIIAAINGCGRFSPLRFEMKDNGQQEVEYTVSEWVEGNKQNRKVKTTIHNLSCVAWAVEKETGERITSPTVSVEMAVKEGWYQKNGSKWQTMPEVMLRYRTASFFGKLYAPELLMGLQTVEEMQDIVIDARQDESGAYSVDLQDLQQKAGEDLKTGTADAPMPNVGDVIDATTGEILRHDDPDDAALRSVEQAGAGQAPHGDGPTFEDATAAVKTGDFDLARDMARAFPEGQKQAIEQAIANAGKKDTAPTRPRRERGQGGLAIE